MTCTDCIRERREYGALRCTPCYQKRQTDFTSLGFTEKEADDLITREDIATERQNRRFFPNGYALG